jgi:hypothetical protein
MQYTWANTPEPGGSINNYNDDGNGDGDGDGDGDGHDDGHGHGHSDGHGDGDGDGHCHNCFWWTHIDAPITLASNKSNGRTTRMRFKTARRLH